MLKTGLKTMLKTRRKTRLETRPETTDRSPDRQRNTNKKAWKLVQYTTSAPAKSIPVARRSMLNIFKDMFVRKMIYANIRIHAKLVRFLYSEKARKSMQKPKQM